MENDLTQLSVEELGGLIVDKWEEEAFKISETNFTYRNNLKDMAMQYAERLVEIQSETARVTQRISEELLRRQEHIICPARQHNSWHPEGGTL